MKWGAEHTGLVEATATLGPEGETELHIYPGHTADLEPSPPCDWQASTRQSTLHPTFQHRLPAAPLASVVYRCIRSYWDPRGALVFPLIYLTHSHYQVRGTGSCH